MNAPDTARWLEWAGTLEQALLETSVDNLACVTDITQAVCWRDAPRGEWLYDAHRVISGMRPNDLLHHMTAYAPARLQSPSIRKPRESWTYNILQQSSGYYAIYGSLWPVNRIDAALTINVAEWVPIVYAHLCPHDGAVMNICGPRGREYQACGYQE